MTDDIKIISKQEYLKGFKKPKQEEVWDNIAETWKEYRKRTPDFIEKFLKNKKGKIIDLGCGSGRNLVFNKDLEYYEIDFSEKQLKLSMQRARELGIKAFFIKTSADDLKCFKNKMFDYGLFIATLHCIESEKNRKNALKEFHRLLKKNAEGLITVWNSEDFRFNQVNNQGDIYMSWKINGKRHMRYYYLYSKAELLSLIKSVGFKILGINSNTDIKDSACISNSLKDRFSRKNWIVKVKK